MEPIGTPHHAGIWAPQTPHWNSVGIQLNVFGPSSHSPSYPLPSRAHPPITLIESIEVLGKEEECPKLGAGGWSPSYKVTLPTNYFCGSIRRRLQV